MPLPLLRYFTDDAPRTRGRSRLLLALGVALSVLLFGYVGRTFRVPAEPGFDGGLLFDPAGALGLSNLVVVGVALVACVLVSTLVAGTIRFDAGLFCAAFGLAAVSVRMGRMGDVLRSAASATAPSPSPSVFVRLAIELALLYALLGLAWSALWLLHRAGYLKADEFRDGVEDVEDAPSLKVGALVMQAGVTALLVMLLVQTDAKTQALIGVFVASFLGSCAAYYMYPISPSPWLWCGPMIVGCIGYALAYFSTGPGDELWRTGQLRFTLAPLGRPLPIDYATAGPIGALLGYWMSRRWHRQEQDEAATAAA